jgi:hypothetical protein
LVAQRTKLNSHSVRKDEIMSEKMESIILNGRAVRFNVKGFNDLIKEIRRLDTLYKRSLALWSEAERNCYAHCPQEVKCERGTSCVDNIELHLNDEDAWNG